MDKGTVRHPGELNSAYFLVAMEPIVLHSGVVVAHVKLVIETARGKGKPPGLAYQNVICKHCFLRCL